MSNDIGLWLFVVYPSVPHDLMRKEGILGDAHGIGNTTGAIVRLTAMVSVGVGEHNLHTTCRDTGTCARTLTPVVVPTAYHLDGKLIHVMVIVIGWLATIERTVALLMEGIAVFVPILAQPLVTTVFHGPHGVLVRFVDIQHLTTILRLVDVQHLTTADSPSAVRVELVANALHFKHVFAADALVATFVEDNGRIIPIIDDGVAHQFRTLVPTGTFHVLLSITGRHGLDQAHTVARLDVLLPRRHVHPAHEVSTRFHHQGIAVVAKPGRDRDAYARPLVACALGIAVHHKYTVVEPYLALTEARLTEASPCGDYVDGGTVDHEGRLHGIQVAVAPRPEVQTTDRLLGFEYARLTRLHDNGFTLELGHLIAVGINHLGTESKGSRTRILVTHL